MLQLLVKSTVIISNACTVQKTDLGPIRIQHCWLDTDPDPIRIQHCRLDKYPGCGSGLDPCLIGLVDPDPYSESVSGSGSRRAKKDPQK